MQYKVLCLLFKRWALVVEMSILCYGGGRTGACSYVSFILFKTKYVRYLMAFWCVFFTRVSILDFEILRSASFLMECSFMTPLAPGYDGDAWVLLSIRCFVWC